jgi:signal transduction histidine kinase
MNERKSMNVDDRVNILMVDDQPAKLLSYEAILAELGENLIKANSGNEALELLLKNDIAVVLMDVSMPGLDGFELAEMIRQHPRFQQIAIIFISAVHLTDIDRLQGYQRGAVDYISVPVIPELLRAKVSVFAELHRKTRELEMLNQELRRLSNALIVSQDEERRRIARELHDGLGQELSAAKMLMDGLSNPDLSTQWKENAASEGSATLGRAIQQVRSVSHLLHPPLLDEVGLCSALQQYLEGFTKRSGIETCVNLPSQELPRFKPELETAIFRIIQEALTNVLRHSEARKAWITIGALDSQVTVTVRDDGKGIPKHVAELRSGSVGIGISGMRQRVKEFGGQVHLKNANPGTLVEVAIPIGAMVRSPQAADVVAP